MITKPIKLRYKIYGNKIYVSCKVNKEKHYPHYDFLSGDSDSHPNVFGISYDMTSEINMCDDFNKIDFLSNYLFDHIIEHLKQKIVVEPVKDILDGVISPKDEIFKELQNWINNFDRNRMFKYFDSDNMSELKNLISAFLKYKFFEKNNKIIQI